MVRIYTVSLFSAIQETERGKFVKMDFYFPDFRKNNGYRGAC